MTPWERPRSPRLVACPTGFGTGTGAAAQSQRIPPDLGACSGATISIPVRVLQPGRRRPLTQGTSTLATAAATIASTCRGRKRCRRRAPRRQWSFRQLRDSGGCPAAPGRPRGFRSLLGPGARPVRAGRRALARCQAGRQDRLPSRRPAASAVSARPAAAADLPPPVSAGGAAAGTILRPFRRLPFRQGAADRRDRRARRRSRGCALPCSALSLPQADESLVLDPLRGERRRNGCASHCAFVDPERLRRRCPAWDRLAPSSARPRVPPSGGRGFPPTVPQFPERHVFGRRRGW